MDVGRPPLARFHAGDVRLSETLITYADLDEAIAKVPAGCACTFGVVDFCDISYHSPSHLQTCPTALGVAFSTPLTGLNAASGFTFMATFMHEPVDYKQGVVRVC